jgi:hypothetical protein
LTQRIFHIGIVISILVSLWSPFLLLGILQPVQHQNNQQRFKRLTWWEKQKKSTLLIISNEKLSEIHWENDFELEWQGVWYDIISWKINHQESIFQVITDHEDTQLAENQNRENHHYIHESQNPPKYSNNTFPILFIHHFITKIYLSQIKYTPFSFGYHNNNQDKLTVKKLLRPPIFHE